MQTTGTPPTTRTAPSAVLLDALGTLVALEPPAPRLRTELARRFGLEVSEREAARAIAAEIAYYRAHLDDGRDEPGLQALRRRCAGVLRDTLPPAGLELDLLLDALLASLRFTAFADARPALEAARSRGQRLVVASNWDVSLHGVLRALELEPLLDGILTSAEAGARKPAPAIFEQALALAGARPGDADPRRRQPRRGCGRRACRRDRAGARPPRAGAGRARRAGRSRALPSWPGWGFRGALRVRALS